MTAWYVQNSAGNDNNGGTSWNVLATATDGATNGTNTLTSASNLFTAAMVGQGIFIGGVNQWRLITVFNSAGSINFSGATIASGSGRTYTVGGRFATISKAVGIAGLAAGDNVYIAPGTYRETVTSALAGGGTYTTGTVAVTNGSAVVTGTGTTWGSGNVIAGGHFQIQQIAHGTDGVTVAHTGTTQTFTSAAGNFQSGMVGETIRINTIGAYIITAVASKTSITVAKPDNSSFTWTANTALTYDVGPESVYDILTQDSNTQITLSSPWAGPTLTLESYICWKPIRYIADYLGTYTDGVGGEIRLTGAAANDQSASRSNALTMQGFGYQTFIGFRFDSTSSILVQTNGNVTNVVVANCYFEGAAGNSLFNAAGTANVGVTVKNCCFIGNSSPLVYMQANSTSNSNLASLIENCIFVGAVGGSGRGIQVDRQNGILVRNCIFRGCGVGIQITAALVVGQAITVNNCLFESCLTALQSTTANELLENYNNIVNCSTARTNPLVGANSKAYLTLCESRWFFQLVFGGAGPYRAAQVVNPFDLATYSPLANVAGIYPSGTDMRGTAPIGAAREWGPAEIDTSLNIFGRPLPPLTRPGRLRTSAQQIAPR